MFWSSSAFKTVVLFEAINVHERAKQSRCDDLPKTKSLNWSSISSNERTFGGSDPSKQRILVRSGTEVTSSSNSLPGYDRYSGTSPVGHLHSGNTKFWSRKNVHVIFVSASVSTSIEGKSLLRKRGILSGFQNPRFLSYLFFNS